MFGTSSAGSSQVVRFATQAVRLAMVVALAGALLGGCAQKVRVSEMVSRSGGAPASQNSPLRQSVCVGEVSGGEATNSLWTPEISNADFAGALEQSLARHGLLAASPERCRLALNAHLQSLHQPSIAITMTASASVTYNAKAYGLQAQPFRASIRLPYTVRYGAAFLGPERLRIASEGAIRVNIEALIARFSLHYQRSAPR